ncbi:hypothetical protein [Geomicrobium sp. JCM 19055]|uniref:hypothetical protein n=1 Tax=Geomicrobium sp. JCM 19055 TaxID=1460649 RepID=UPI00045ED53C|nr:hypothetical protein [Geomicrobium sp. JCM 19055]GAK00777.1 ferredoxin reductase [Geomicrobium sp. JCM 19055]
MHTFSHAHAVHASSLRSEDPTLIRALMHTVVSLSLDSFLNIPAAKRPKPVRLENDQLDHFLDLFDTQQPVDTAASWALSYAHQHSDVCPLFAAIGEAMLREDAKFHTLQMYEAACFEYDKWDKQDVSFAKEAKDTLLIALTRYVAAHSPTQENCHVLPILHGDCIVVRKCLSKNERWSKDNPYSITHFSVIDHLRFLIHLEFSTETSNLKIAEATQNMGVNNKKSKGA